MNEIDFWVPTWWPQLGKGEEAADVVAHVPLAEGVQPSLQTRSLCFRLFACTTRLLTFFFFLLLLLSSLGLSDTNVYEP